MSCPKESNSPPSSIIYYNIYAYIAENSKSGIHPELLNASIRFKVAFGVSLGESNLSWNLLEIAEPF